jgi:hypothetical protein
MPMGTPHYYVKVARALPSDEWFAVVARIKTYMNTHGFEFDEFGDSDESDRQAVWSQGVSCEFEGQVVYPKIVTGNYCSKPFY